MKAWRRTDWIFGLTILISMTTAHAESRPTVVELYTSEGCSSCPPADVYVGELAKRTDVLAVSFHVDYWDDLGWRDTAALPSATSRQRLYARRLGLNSIFTPQIVVDGHESFVGSDRTRINPRLGLATAELAIALSRQADELLVSVGSDQAPNHNDVILIPFSRRSTSPVGRGENRGRTLEEFNVVRDLRTIGQTRAEPQQWHVMMRSIPKDATDVAVLVQRAEQGEIVAAARLDLMSAPPSPPR